MKKILFIVSLVIFFTSCLKDKEYNDGVIGHQVSDQKIVELGIANSVNMEKSIALDYVDRDTTISLRPVRISSGASAPNDINVTIDTSLTSIYIAENPDLNLVHFNEADITVASAQELTIKSGALATLPIKIKVNPITFDPSSRYVIVFKIKSISDAAYQISENFNTLVVTLVAKNKYDGKYSLVFKNKHPTLNPGYTGETVEVYLITTSGNSVKIYWPDFEGYANPAILSGNLTAFSAQEPEYTIDEVTNKVTVQNTAPDAVTFYTMNPDYDSRYDPATKKLYAKWGYTSGTAPPFSREWTQEFTYLGPR